jgi:hypothetical protein
MMSGFVSQVSQTMLAALPDTGVTVETLITKGITAMGAGVAVAVGGYIAFKIVKKALGWVGRGLG